MEPTVPLLPEPDHLERVVTIVEGITATQGFDGPHLLIKIEAGAEPDEFELGMKPLPDGCHPAEELWGFEAPPEWLAIGLVSYGWCGPLGEGRPSLHPDRRRVRATMIVDRTGAEAMTAALDDGTMIDEPAEGLVGDVLRRCIGQPTAPPPPLQELVDVMWLQAVADSPRPMAWTRIDDLRTRMADGATTWTRLRTLASGHPEWALAGRWMDDGMFARQLLGSLPSIEELLTAIEGKLPAAIAQRVRDALLSD